VESVKSAEDFYSPVSGRVIEVNKILEKNPEEINKNAYEAWIVKLKMSNISELNNLMKKEAYEKIIK
ncbi:MAG: glycine cleavage system protein H, partial [Thermoplasmatales archaeon]